MTKLKNLNYINGSQSNLYKTKKENSINYNDRKYKAREKIILEDTRAQYISKSRNADLYKNNIRGKNRFERKKYSKISSNVKEYNNIDMNALFKQDMLSVGIKVFGETKEYFVNIQFDGVISELAKNIKNNNYVFEFKTVLQALTKVFNSSNIKVKCNCEDFRFRFAHQLIINNNSVDGSDKDPGPGKTGMANTQSNGCKHILLCISNQDWLIKLASTIKNYIIYMDKNKHTLFMKIIFPKIYGVIQEDAFKNNLVPEDTTLETETSVIDIINEFAKNRGKFKKGLNKNPASGTGKIDLNQIK